MHIQALLCLAALFTFKVSAEETKPNIIYIMLDDAGYGDFSCYGQTKFKTPNIDKVAAEGLKFTDHYAGSTVCAPTRCILMTGLHSGHAYIRANREVRPEGQWHIPADSITIAEKLKEAGYTTGMFGKWGLGAPGSVGDPLEQGFDTFYGYLCQRHAHNYYPNYIRKDRERIPLDGKTYTHDLIVEEALGFIKANKGKRFFCYLPVTIPHAAMHVPERYVGPFRKQFPEFENRIGKYSGPKVKNPVAAFAGMMTKLDEDVGRVMALLKELGIDENTLVMITSDNGAHREGGHNPKFFKSCGKLRGIKRDLYDGGIRVPLIARWPGRIKAGTTTDHISAHWDVMPTFCDLAGVSAPAKTDGISMLPSLLGQASKQKKHDYLYWEYRGKQAIRMGKWKAVRYGVTKAPEKQFQIFNLEDDISEKKDVASAQPEIAAQMQKIAKSARVESELFRLFKLK